MSILFYTTRSITSNLSGGLLANLAVLETEDSEVDFLTSKKTDRSALYITQKTGLSIRKSRNLFGDFYMNECLTKKSWQEIYDSLDVSELKEYSAFYIMGGLFSPSGDVFRFSKKLPKFLESSVAIKFNQIGVTIINVLALIKAHKEFSIPLHEFSYDTDELACSLITQMNENYFQYHIYDLPRYNMKRLDSLLYSLAKDQAVTLMEIEKKFDLTFGYTVFPNGNRPSYVDWVNRSSEKFERVNLYTINKITGLDTSIPRENYLNKIQESRFTFIIPSYDKMCFSLYRFIESIHHDCLPLIHPDCYTDEVEQSFGISFLPLKGDIPTEKERVELLSYYKEKLLTCSKLFRK